MNDVVTPERSLEQRLVALSNANVIRIHRARLKREMKAGRKQFVELLDDPRCETMKIFEALIAIPKYGRVKVNRILTQCRISPSKTLGGLSPRQRNELCGYFR